MACSSANQGISSLEPLLIPVSSCSSHKALNQLSHRGISNGKMAPAGKRPTQDFPMLRDDDGTFLCTYALHNTAAKMHVQCIINV